MSIEMEGKITCIFSFHQRLRFPLVNDAFCKYLVDNFAKMHLKAKEGAVKQYFRVRVLQNYSIFCGRHIFVVAH